MSPDHSPIRINHGADARSSNDGHSGSKDRCSTLSSFDTLRKQFPRTPIKVFISESLRCIRSALRRYVIERSPDFKLTKMYFNNKVSFHLLLQIISSPLEAHNELVCSTLYLLPSKEGDLMKQISHVNDAVALLRHHNTFPMPYLHYIRIGEASFDDSQDSNKQYYSAD